MQKVIFPWETKKWSHIHNKLSDPIGSIVELDNCIYSLSGGLVKPKMVSQMFATYYNEQQYETDRIPDEMLLKVIIPFLQKLILGGPKLFKGFTGAALVPGRAANIVLLRPQVLTIVACMWFGLFEYDFLSAPNDSNFLSPLLFNIFHGHNMLALQCILNYFRRAHIAMTSDDELIVNTFEAGNIIIKRTVLTEPPDWISTEIPITEVFIGDGQLDDAPTKMHVAYAHESIGGSLFRESLSQEELILLVRPECLPALIFCAKMRPDETVTIMGAEKLSQYSGRGSGTRFAGDYVDDTPLGYNHDATEVMSQCAIIFMDASHRATAEAQLKIDFQRDLNKAYCGFNSLKFKSPGVKVASGNWSYDFKGNNAQVKFIQQVLAASCAGKCLVYFPFGRDFEEQLLPFIDWLSRSRLLVCDLFEKYLLVLKDHIDYPARLGDANIFEKIMEI